ncbi:hypothetical protein NWP17_13785 [Chrysosporum bergii ANA360D]|uniref:Uncharacterized protein n=1 Tax=Chrysosporum bergii ANA360D TaxID=617107 RepID=A0AA43GTX0_9CYAN|nr:hypothetical protein [Chrysosporum bergii]MDH6061495.1 hypothetical protein [Chrysosporum bergii ANA360D]
MFTLNSHYLLAEVGQKVHYSNIVDLYNVVLQQQPFYHESIA